MAFIVVIKDNAGYRERTLFMLAMSCPDESSASRAQENFDQWLEETQRVLKTDEFGDEYDPRFQTWLKLNQPPFWGSCPNSIDLEDVFAWKSVSTGRWEIPTWSWAGDTEP